MAYSTTGKSESDLMAERTRTLAEIKKRGGLAAAPNYADRLRAIDAALSAMRKAAGVTGPPNENRPALQPPAQQPAPAPTPAPPTGSTPGVPAPDNKFPEVTPAPNPIVDIPISGDQAGVGNPKYPGIDDPNAAVGTVTGTAQDDVTKTFRMQNPEMQQDIFGNTQQIVYDPVTGQTKIVQSGGQSFNAAQQAFMGAAQDFGGAQGAAQNAFNSTYNYITQNYAAQRDKEIEDTAQRLRNQGIPENPDPNSLWGRTMKQIGDKWQSNFDQASNQAIGMANQTLSTRAGVLGQVGSTLQGQSPQFAAFQGGASNIAANLQNILSTISDSELAKYGIDKDFAAKIRAIAAQKNGGGGGGSADTGPIIGGNTAPGFEV